MLQLQPSRDQEAHLSDYYILNSFLFKLSLLLKMILLDNLYHLSLWTMFFLEFVDKICSKFIFASVENSKSQESLEFGA